MFMFYLTVIQSKINIICLKMSVIYLKTESDIFHGAFVQK